jgi:leucyl aminopeptidase (aminopeptidase T)
LSECVDLKQQDVLALFWDETTEETAKIFLDAASILNLEVRRRYVTLEAQASFSEEAGLSAEDSEALDSARGIITCLSNQVAGTAYRTALLAAGTVGGKRFGHMPGANLEVLAHAVNINYSEATSRCDDLALALTLGEKVRLQTYVFDAEGNRQESYDLHFEIGGLHRSPITSTGIIPLGTWGNLPGGETFIAPIEDTASGVFVLNGAFKNYVIPPPGHLLLHFEAGRMIKVNGTPDEEAAFNKILDYARARSDANYNTLAELGIGVNPGIKELTGNALFDEKCHGTAHIAIGDSSRYGGKHSSKIHEDLISHAPSLWIDDEPILNGGENAFESTTWREELKDWIRNDEPIDADSILARTTIKAGSGSAGRLRVRRNVTAGRVCLYTIGEPTTGRTLNTIYSAIPAIPQQIKLQELYRVLGHADPSLKDELIDAALRILLRHGLVTIRSNGEG